MSLAFDGANGTRIDYTNIAGVSGATALSFAFWVHAVGAVVANDAYLNKTGNIDFWIGPAGDVHGRLQWRLGAGGGRAYTNSSIGVDTWEHWAFAYNGGGATDDDKIKIYKNGVLETLTHAVAQPAALPTGTGVVQLGGNEVSISPVCRLAHAKMWLETLDSETLRREMFAYVPSHQATLVLWAPFDDGTRAKDFSVRNNAPTVAGGVTSVVTGDPAEVIPGDQSLLTWQRTNARRLQRTRRDSFNRLGGPTPYFI